MDYNLIKYKPNDTIDAYFKRIILKLCQLYPYYKKEIELITQQLQQYRDLLEEKNKSNQQLNETNINNMLKKIDDKLAQFYNNEKIAREVYLKQLKLMSKLLKEDFKISDYQNIPFQKLYSINKDKYDLMNEELKDMFFDYYTSSKKVKPIMEILKLYYSLKEKKLRNIIRSEINAFKSELKADAFKEVKKDTKEYLTKQNELLAKSIRNETKQLIEGSPLDKLRLITSQEFDTKGKENLITNELLSQLQKFNLLKQKYKPLIARYEQAKESDKFSVVRDIESALYDIKPLYENIKRVMDKVNNVFFEKNKKYELIKSIEGINEKNKEQINKLYQDFSKYSYLFDETEKPKYEGIINDKYDKVFRGDIQNALINGLKEKYKTLKFSKTNPEKHTKGTNKGEYTLKLNKPWNTEIERIIKDYKYIDVNDALKNKFNSKEMKDKIIFEVKEEQRKIKEAEELKKQQEEELERQKQEAEELKKKQEEELEKQKQEEEKRKQQEELEKQEEQEEELQEQEPEINGSEKNLIKGCDIFDLEKKTLTQILKEINDKYNKLPNEKLDGVIYINLKKRFPKKEDFNKFFIQQLKKFDKKYNYDKYKQYMKDKKYSQDYIVELEKGGFLGNIIKGVIGIGKKLLGFNQDVLDDKRKGCGIISSIASMLGLNENELNNIDNKYKEIFNLLRKEKNNNKIDAYLYAIAKLDDDDDSEEEIKKKFKELQYKYDEIYRKDLFNKRIKKDYYNNTGSFSPLLIGAIPAGISAISNLISSISNAVRGKNECVNKKEPNDIKGGKIMTLSELKQLSKEIN